MNNKLSKKERGELVTKGYFHAMLDEILDERFQDFRKEINKDFEQHIAVLMEENQDRFQVIFEELTSIRDENKKRIELCENRLDRVEHALGVA